MPQTRVQGKFYPLQEEELIALREKKLINNTAYVHLALKLENPFCDRAIEIYPKQFALRWNLPESSVYKAIARLKDLKLLAIKTGKLIISWIVGSNSAESDNTQKEEVIEESSEVKTDYQIREPIIKSGNELSDPAIDYQIRQNRGLKALGDIAPACLQTIQNFKKIQTNQKEVEQNKVQEEEVNQERKLIKLNYDVAQSEGKKDNSKEIHKRTTEVKEKNNVPARVTRKKSKIPDDLRDKLETLGISIDDKILKAIAEYDISQAYGAAAHVENTWDTIKNPRSVFLFQLPKQPIEKLGARLPEIGQQMAKENQAWDEEMASDEYKSKSQEMFAKLRAKLGGKKP